MLQRTPSRNRDDDPLPWWSGLLDSTFCRGVIVALIVLLAVVCIYSILTNKSHMTTVPQNPGFAR